MHTYSLDQIARWHATGSTATPPPMAPVELDAWRAQWAATFAEEDRQSARDAAAQTRFNVGAVIVLYIIIPAVIGWLTGG